MKKILRNIFLNFLTLFFISKLIGGIDFQDNFLILFWAAVFLSLLNFLVKPILNLLLMPINLLTLGAFRWLINVVVLFLVTLFVSGFKIISFTFPGWSAEGFVIPPINISFFWALILISFLIEVVFNLLNWLFS